MTEELAKTLPTHAFRCQLIHLLSQGKAKEATDFLKKYMSDFYQTCRPAVRSAILSLQFIAHLKANEHLQAITLVQKSELKWEPFPSVDKDGKPILCTA
jgi:hypothetical protein